MFLSIQPSPGVYGRLNMQNSTSLEYSVNSTLCAKNSWSMEVSQVMGVPPVILQSWMTWGLEKPADLRSILHHPATLGKLVSSDFTPLGKPLS